MILSRNFPFVAIVSLVTLTAFEVRIGKIEFGPLSFYLTSARIAILLACLAVIAWAAGRFSTLSDKHRSVSLSGLLFLAVALISALSGPYRGAGIERVFFYSSLYCLFWAALVAPDDRAIKRLPGFLFLLGIVMGLLACVQYFSWDYNIIISKAFLPDFRERFRYAGPNFMPFGGNFATGSLQNPSTFGCYMVFALICGFLIRRKVNAFWMISGCVILIAGIVFSGSRLAAASLICFLSALLSLALKNRRLAPATSAAGGLILLMASVLWLGQPKIRHAFSLDTRRLSSLNWNNFSSGRLSLWMASLKIWRDHRLLGVGPGNFDKYYGDYLGSGLGKDTYTHPHNLLARILCETGLIGFTAFAGFAAASCRLIFRRQRAQEQSWPFVAFFIFEMFEEFTRDAFPALIFAWAVVYAIRCADENSKQRT